jgi:hypothetical protein
MAFLPMRTTPVALFHGRRECQANGLSAIYEEMAALLGTIIEVERAAVSQVRA